MRSPDFFVFVLLSTLPGSISAVELVQPVTAPDQRIALPDSFIVFESEQVQLEGRKLVRGLDYTLDYLTSTLQLHLSFARTGTLRIRYQRLLLPLKKTHFLRTPPRIADSLYARGRYADSAGNRQGFYPAQRQAVQRHAWRLSLWVGGDGVCPLSA